MPSVTRQVSEPYRSTDLTELVLKILMLFTLYAECRRSPHWFQTNEGLFCCLSNPVFDVLFCACVACS
ncbi:unnamed protein product [Heterobilharzia americana]|nr:unnamed protein product [Heterobilharzia americana]